MLQLYNNQAATPPHLQHVVVSVAVYIVTLAVQRPVLLLPQHPGEQVRPRDSFSDCKGSSSSRGCKVPGVEPVAGGEGLAPRHVHANHPGETSEKKTLHLHRGAAAGQADPWAAATAGRRRDGSGEEEGEGGAGGSDGGQGKARPSRVLAPGARHTAPRVWPFGLRGLQPADQVQGFHKINLC